MSKETGMKSDSRRSFLARLTGGLLGVGVLITSWPLLRSLFPNVLYEPPRRFPLGNPQDFQQGVTYIDEQRIYVFRDGNSFHAISGVCSHLGCSVKFAPFDQVRDQRVRNLDVRTRGEFHCPCHGSKFHGEGTNYAGPAPRPLKWYHLELSPSDEQLVIDVAREVDREFRLVV